MELTLLISTAWYGFTRCSIEHMLNITIQTLNTEWPLAAAVALCPSPLSSETAAERRMHIHGEPKTAGKGEEPLRCLMKWHIYLYLEEGYLWNAVIIVPWVNSPVSHLLLTTYGVDYFILFLWLIPWNSDKEGMKNGARCSWPHKHRWMSKQVLGPLEGNGEINLNTKIFFQWFCAVLTFIKKLMIKLFPREDKYFSIKYHLFCNLFYDNYEGVNRIPSEKNDTNIITPIKIKKLRQSTWFFGGIKIWVLV